MTKTYLENDPAGDAELECTLDEARTARIRALNDALRRTLQGGQVYTTRGVAARGQSFVGKVYEAVRSFCDFTVDNDPHGEHDFGAFTLDGVRLYWKIDTYDDTLEYGSPDAANPEQTQRGLTIMLAEEY